MLTEIPVLLLAQIIFSIIVYFGIGLYANVWAFTRFTFTVILLGFSASSFGQFLSVLFNRPETAVAASPIIMLPLIVLGGFLVNSGTTAAWIAWLQYISPVRYGFESFT